MNCSNAQTATTSTESTRSGAGRFNKDGRFEFTWSSLTEEEEVVARAQATAHRDRAAELMRMSREEYDAWVITDHEAWEVRHAAIREEEAKARGVAAAVAAERMSEARRVHEAWEVRHAAIREEEAKARAAMEARH